MSDAAAGTVALPSWAVVSEPRRAHIARVTALLIEWAHALQLDAAARSAWHDAGALHDALRDAPASSLGAPRVDPSLPRGAWHGPAAAERLRADGETREDVLSAIRWHTVGHADWEATGRALFAADFLEPGRPFLTRERAALAMSFPTQPDHVFREVVRLRVERARTRGLPLHPRTLALWEAVR